jgi:hypothetical protein
VVKNNNTFKPITQEVVTVNGVARSSEPRGNLPFNKFIEELGNGSQLSGKNDRQKTEPPHLCH